MGQYYEEGSQKSEDSRMLSGHEPVLYKSEPNIATGLRV